MNEETIMNEETEGYCGGRVIVDGGCGRGRGEAKWWDYKEV